MWLIVYWRAILDCQPASMVSFTRFMETFLVAIGLKNQEFG